MTDYTEEEKNHICVNAYFLAQRKHPYDTLCWMLSERQLFIENNNNNASIDKIRERSAHLYHSCCDYDVLTWLICELNFLLKDSKFKQF